MLFAVVDDDDSKDDDDNNSRRAATTTTMFAGAIDFKANEWPSPVPIRIPILHISAG